MGVALGVAERLLALEVAVAELQALLREREQPVPVPEAAAKEKAAKTVREKKQVQDR